MEGREEREVQEIAEYENSTISELEDGGEAEPEGSFMKLAHAVSIILHPLFIPVILFGLIFYFSPRITAPLTSENRLAMWGVLALATLVIPIVSLVVLRYVGNLPSLRMSRREDRSAPFLYVSVFYAFTTYLFISKNQGFVNINIMLAGITFIIFLVTLITLYWKISAHSAGIWGAVGFLASFMLLYHELGLLYPLAGMIVLAGLVMSARLYLNEHKPIEVWVGALLGFSVSFSSVFFFSFL